MSGQDTVHATSVAIGEYGVLLIGPSGSGKSDLALRLIDRGATLVSDDYTVLSIKNGCLSSCPPDRIAGKIEVRGLGIIDMPHRPSSHIVLAVFMNDVVARLPDQNRVAEFLGVNIAATSVCAHESSAPIKVELALRRALDIR